MPQSIQSQSGCRIDVDYPSPIVNHKTAYQTAKQLIYKVKRDPETKKASQKVYRKHGSRRRPSQRR